MSSRHCALATVSIAAVTAITAVPLDAQCTGFFPQTIRATNVSYLQTDIPVSRNSALGLANFTADSRNQGDVLFQFWHYYRLDGLNREFSFKAINQCLDLTYGPDRATFDWPDVDVRGRISARLEYVVVSRTPDSGCLISTMTITFGRIPNPSQIIRIGAMAITGMAWEAMT